MGAAIAQPARRCYALRMLIERIFAGIIIAAALATGTMGMRAPPSVVPVPAALPLSTTPLPLDRDEPARDRIGVLRFLGAVQLRSTNPLFGGLSGLRSGVGDRMLAISDTGNWIAFDTVERGGRLVGVANGLIAPIRQPDGGAPATKSDGDAEALEWDPASGTATIVFEQNHRLVHFAGIDPDRPASLGAVPIRTEWLTAMTGWPANGGGEAIAILTPGARIVISERQQRADGSHIGLLTVADMTVEIGIGGVEDHAPTDAIALDDHRILVLNRRFSMMGQSSVLTLVDLAPAIAGPITAPLPARELARLAPPLTLDNMEGLALRRTGGRTFVYMVSDDNLNGLQKTVLMKFELEP